MDTLEPDLNKLTRTFALRIIRLYTGVHENNSAAAVLGKQLLRSGTSVGANYREAPRARSKAEFISKIGDCLKEIEETRYWLELLVESGSIPAKKMSNLLDECSRLVAIFATIDKRSKANRDSSAP